MSGKSRITGALSLRMGSGSTMTNCRQEEVALRTVISDVQQHGAVLLVVDQPNTIGALPIAVARDLSAHVAYLPGLAMRKAADLPPGRSKTDAREAFIIAGTARAMPHTLRGWTETRTCFRR